MPRKQPARKDDSLPANIKKYKAIWKAAQTAKHPEMTDDDLKWHYHEKMYKNCTHFLTDDYGDDYLPPYCIACEEAWIEAIKAKYGKKEL